MRLTKEEIEEVAGNLDDIIGKYFLDTVNDVYFNRTDAKDGWFIEDEDIYKIKKELKLYL
mgnify:FL=1|jgi:hypothetical protein|tara:strand:+ start:341 stop:520 length:180 start_codon:yes stop_codon:yes gene_type:complete